MYFMLFTIDCQALLAVIYKCMQHKFSHKHHIKNTKTDNEYIVKMGRCGSMPLNFKQEAINAAKLISKESKDIWISYSGGIDSEFIIRTFIEAEINFKIATVVMKGEINDYDLQHSRDFCKSIGLPLHEFELDLELFYQNNLDEYAQNTRCVSPQFPVHMWLWDQLDGFIVAGHGDPIFKRKDDGWKFQIQEKEDSVYRYAEWRNRNMAPGFYAYTPELLLSFMLEKEVSNMFIAPNRAKLRDIIQVKHQVYSKYYPMTQRDKRTGFENVRNLDETYRTQLKNTIPGNGVFLQPINELLDNLWPKTA